MLRQDLDWGCSGESKTYMLFGKFGPDGGYMFRDQSVNVVRAFLSLAGSCWLKMKRFSLVGRSL